MKHDLKKENGPVKLEVLVAAMHQRDASLIEKMHITTDAIVGNQCDKNSVEEFFLDGKRIRYLNFAERGVGLNRNNSLMRAQGDILLFADDDMVYEDGYERIVEEAFLQQPDADVIVFNLREKVPFRYVIRKKHRVGYLNYLRYGTARIAARREAIHLNGISFNLCFGGGTAHSHGEDNLFLTDCLKKGLKIYAVPEYLAALTEERESSWATGYGEKYLRDQGTLYRQISRRFWKLLCLQDLIRHRKRYADCGLTLREAYAVMKAGGTASR